MTDQTRLLEHLLLISAGMARDLDAAGILTDATRKAIHNGLAEIRNLPAARAGEAGDGEAELKAAVAILDDIPPAADG